MSLPTIARLTQKTSGAPIEIPAEKINIALFGDGQFALNAAAHFENIKLSIFGDTPTALSAINAPSVHLSKAQNKDWEIKASGQIIHASIVIVLPTANSSLFDKAGLNPVAAFNERKFGFLKPSPLAADLELVPDSYARKTSDGLFVFDPMDGTDMRVFLENVARARMNIANPKKKTGLNIQ